MSCEWRSEGLEVLGRIVSLEEHFSRGMFDMRGLVVVSFKLNLFKVRISLEMKEVGDANNNR